MAGWEKMTTAESTLISAKSSAGNNQFATEGGAVFTSSKTSPGVAKTLSSRAPKDIAGRPGAVAAGSGMGGGIGSITMWAAKQARSRQYHGRSDAPLSSQARDRFSPSPPR